MFGELPAWGFYVRHVNGLTLDQIELKIEEPDYRPAFVFDDVTKQFVRREDLRTRIFSLMDAGLVIHILPGETRLDEVQYVWDENNRRLITDKKTFSMNINEFSLNR
mgnify:CR=1 FL=1